MAAPLTLAQLRHCLEGVLPALIATCDAAGEPNVTYLSKVFYVDPDHVALSNQFFSKTVANLRQNPFAEITLMEPGSTRHFRFDAEYVKSIDTGDLFEQASAEIDAIASLIGLDEGFRLRALDIYSVSSIYRVPCDLDQTDG